jgi:CDP-glycerol glycerophosphotransferase
MRSSAGMPHVEYPCRVSIIIPHYNQKECLKTLLPSIANQTFRNYDVLVIDDCTPDRSAVEYIEYGEPAFYQDRQQRNQAGGGRLHLFVEQ